MAEGQGFEPSLKPPCQFAGNPALPFIQIQIQTVLSQACKESQSASNIFVVIKPPEELAGAIKEQIEVGCQALWRYLGQRLLEVREKGCLEKNFLIATSLHDDCIWV
jgi:hypothetical protein